MLRLVRTQSTHAVRPRKHRISCLWPCRDQIIPPDRCRNTRLPSSWAKYATIVTLREFTALVVQIFYGKSKPLIFHVHAWNLQTCSRKVIKHCPWATVGEQHGREENRMEVDVVLAHELEEADVVVVEPPLFPLRRVVRSDTGISNRCIELPSSQRIVSSTCDIRYSPRHLQKRVRARTKTTL